jgi:hypothetical protein
VEDEVEGVVVVDSEVDLEWVIILLDLLEMVVEGIMDLTALALVLPHLHHTVHTLHHLKLRTVELEDTAILDYHRIPTLEGDHHHRPTHMLVTHTELLQPHMEDTHHRPHLHYRGMGMEHMALLHRTLTLLHVMGMVEDTEEVEVDTEGMEGMEVVMVEEEVVGVRS